MANHATAISSSSSSGNNSSSSRRVVAVSPRVELRPRLMARPGGAIRLSPATSPLLSSSSSIPRVQAPSLPVRSSPSDSITLTQPRPDGDRVRNEYIDTPLKGGLGLGRTPLHAETHIHISGSPHDHLALVSPLGSQLKTPSSKSLPLTSPSLKRSQGTRRSLPITKQPTLTKAAATSAASNCQLSTSNISTSDSIICPECSRCRCLSCRTPRPLPSKWLCGDKCLCSAESCVDYASCLCCVKGLFYHCGSEDEEDERRQRGCADDPCSCAPSHHRLARWGCLASLTLVLPCLLCYWPLQGGVKVVEMCYQRCTRHGCRCDQPAATTSSSSSSSGSSSGGTKAVVVSSQPLPSKRLLDN